MPLWFLSESDPCLDYIDPGASVLGGITYNPWLITPPRIYPESINRFTQFFYEPGNDRLVGFAWLSQIHWPGWEFVRFEWDALTGELIERNDVSFWSPNYTGSTTLGSYGKIYTTRSEQTKVLQVAWDTLAEQSGGWSWTPPTILQGAGVNLEDDLLVGATAWRLYVYTHLATTKDIVAQFPIPDQFSYLAYENRENVWIVTRTGGILKINYNPTPRWTLMSTITDPPADAEAYFLAFDTKRKRLAVLIDRPDAEDGACRAKIQFYRPIIKIAADALTQPVPVGPSLVGGDLVNFIAHVHGEAGEGLGSVPVTASLAAPAGGSLVNPVGFTGVNGAVMFVYRAPDAGKVDEVLQLSATLSEGE